MGRRAKRLPDIQVLDPAGIPSWPFSRAARIRLPLLEFISTPCSMEFVDDRGQHGVAPF
ncbi:MAG TPA: hypothetical protein VMZ51_01705 [Acidimicrobiales bacterium]|nr:hypothetical protein [Acidimicrobiales bacterium]